MGEAIVFVMEGQLTVLLFLYQVQSTIQRAYPYPVFRVNESVIDIIAADAGRIVFRVPIVRQLIAHWLRTVRRGYYQSVAFGGLPGRC